MGKKANIPKFLKYFGWSRNPYNSQNMGKVNSHSKDKIWGNTNISKLIKCFWNFSLNAEIHAVPKTWEKWISIIREKYGKTQTFQIYGFLKYFGWSRNPYNSENLGKVNFHNTGKKYGKKQTFQSNGFLNYFEWGRNPYNSQNMEKVNSHSIRKIW